MRWSPGVRLVKSALEVVVEVLVIDQEGTEALDGGDSHDGRNGGVVGVRVEHTAGGVIVTAPARGW
jgi:hypothetical protein